MDATDWDARYRAKHAEAGLVWSGEPNVFVAAEAAELPVGRAVDLAAGEGRNAIWLASRGWQVEAVEFSSVALERAAALAEAAGVALTCTLADVTDPPPIASADLVLLAYLQLPSRERRRALAVAASLVAAEGTLLFVAHARRNLTDGVGGPQDPSVLPALDEVLEELGGSGLRVVRAEEVTRRVETEDGPGDAIDLLVRAVRPAHPSRTMKCTDYPESSPPTTMPPSATTPSATTPSATTPSATTPSATTPTTSTSGASDGDPDDRDPLAG